MIQYTKAKAFLQKKKGIRNQYHEAYFYTLKKVIKHHIKSSNNNTSS